MINRVLVRSYLRQAALLWCALAITMFAFAWVRVWVVSLLDMGQFHTMLDQLKEYEKLAPISFDQLFTYQGRVGLTFDEPVVILCTVIWCVSRGSDVVSGELGRGTLEMILAQPISRARLLWSHAAVAIGGLAALCLVVWIGITVGVNVVTVEETVPPPTVQLPVLGWEIPIQVTEPETEAFLLADRVDSGVYAAATFNLFAFGFFILALASLLSSLDRFRWRTVGTVMAIYVIQLVMFGLGKAADQLSWLQGMSFFNCYRPQKLTSLVTEGGSSAPWSVSEAMPDAMLPPLFYPALLIVLGILFYAVAARIFTRRDLPAPV